MNRLEGQVAWITGAGSGIGHGIALALAREGADVILSSRRSEPLATVAGEVEAAGRRAVIAPMDVTDRDQIDTAITQAVDQLSPVSILVNNAGVNTPLRTATERRWRTGTAWWTSISRARSTVSARSTNP